MCMLCVCAQYLRKYLHAITIKEKEDRGHEFEREQRGIHGRIWREDKEWRKWCNYILISKTKWEEGRDQMGHMER